MCTCMHMHRHTHDTENFTWANRSYKLKKWCVQHLDDQYDLYARKIIRCMPHGSIWMWVLTVLVCTWVWSHGGCTVWSETHGMPVQPESHGKTADLQLALAEILCSLKWWGKKRKKKKWVFNKIITTKHLRHLAFSRHTTSVTQNWVAH